MSKSYRTKQSRRSRNYLPHRLKLVALFVVIVLLAPFVSLHAATLSSASVGLSDPRPGATANYTFTGSGVTLAPIKCIKLVYADTASGSTVPAGMVANGAVTLDATSNYMPTPASWTVTKPANGTITLTFAAGETPASAAARKVMIDGIANSTTPDTRWFLRVNTFNNTDCATSPVDSAVVTFINTNGSTLSLTVDDTLSFTINAVGGGQACNGATSTQASTATTIPFGTVSAAANSVVCQDLQAATNASNGYTVYVRYTGKPQNSLAQTINDWTGTNGTPTAFPAPGTEAYAYTTNDFTLGTGTAGRFNANLWAANTTTNTELAYEAAGVNSTTYRVGHQVGVSLTTHPGTYQTTVIYTCTPVY